MITAANIGLAYGTQVLFKEVNIKFTPPGNCYGGVIGANGAGKSTFLKILSGEIEADSGGEVIISSGQRMAVLRQDHFAFNEYSVLETVIMGYEQLYAIMKERDAVYSKEDFTEEDGLRLQSSKVTLPILVDGKLKPRPLRCLTGSVSIQRCSRR